MDINDCIPIILDMLVSKVLTIFPDWTLKEHFVNERGQIDLLFSSPDESDFDWRNRNLIEEHIRASLRDTVTASGIWCVNDAVWRIVIAPISTQFLCKQITKAAEAGKVDWRPAYHIPEDDYGSFGEIPDQITGVAAWFWNWFESLNLQPFIDAYSPGVSVERSITNDYYFLVSRIHAIEGYGPAKIKSLLLHRAPKELSLNNQRLTVGLNKRDEYLEITMKLYDKSMQWLVNQLELDLVDWRPREKIPEDDYGYLVTLCHRSYDEHFIWYDWYVGIAVAAGTEHERAGAVD